jgi:CBS-domain-containing membrane protein
VDWSDLVRHERKAARRLSAHDCYGRDQPARHPATDLGRRFLWELAGSAEVRAVMTPYALCVQPDTPLVKVVEAMLAQHTHRLFVVDECGILVGAVCALDVLRQLRR